MSLLLEKTLKKTLEYVDEDGDGNLTLGEVQEAGKKLVGKVRGEWEKILTLLHTHRHLVEFFTGYIATFYGSNFTHTYLAISTFRKCQNSNDSSGSDALSSMQNQKTSEDNVDELIKLGKSSMESVEKSLGGKNGVLISTGYSSVNDSNSSAGTSTRDASKESTTNSSDIHMTDIIYPSDTNTTSNNPREISESNSSNTLQLKIPPSTILALLSAIDPQKLVEILKSFYSGFLAVLVMSLNENASKFGLGLQLGERLGEMMTVWVEGWYYKYYIMNHCQGNINDSKSISICINEYFVDKQLQCEKFMEKYANKEEVFNIENWKRGYVILVDKLKILIEKMKEIKRKLNDESSKPESEFTGIIDSNELLTSDSSESNAIAPGPDPLKNWRLLLIRSVCTSIGIFLSYRLKSAAATWTICHLGGVKLASSILRFLERKKIINSSSMKQLAGKSSTNLINNANSESDSTTAANANGDPDENSSESKSLNKLAQSIGLWIAIYGFIRQHRRLGFTGGSSSSLPILLAIPLLPVTIVEKILRGLTVTEVVKNGMVK